MKVDVSPDDVDTYSTDDRGRLYLGTEFKNATVEIAVLDVEADDE